MSIIKISTMILSGFLFGFLMQKSQVYAPLNIADQFTFDKFIMLKMFLSAAASSMLILMIMALQDNDFQNKTRSVTVIPMWRIILGGCTLGAGMYFGGSCPGNIYIQLGANVEDVYYTFGGAVVGSLLFYVFDEVLGLSAQINNIGDDKKEKGGNETSVVVNEIPISDTTAKVVTIKSVKLLDEQFEVSQWVLAIPFSLVLSAIVVALEQQFPFNSELTAANQYDQNSMNVFTQKSWPPWIAGILVGFLQLPTRISNNNGLGSATATQSLVSSLVNACGLEAKVTFSKNFNALLQFLQMIFGAVPGAMVSSYLSGQFSNSELVPGVGPLRGFVGGLLLLFGARMAGGCTSGHGLTGFSNLSLQSVINTCCMFGSAIVTGMTAKYLMQ